MESEKKEKKEKKTVAARIEEQAIKDLEARGITVAAFVNNYREQFFTNLKELQEIREENRRLIDDNRRILRDYYSSRKMLDRYLNPELTK